MTEKTILHERDKMPVPTKGRKQKDWRPEGYDAYLPKPASEKPGFFRGARVLGSRRPMKP